MIGVSRSELLGTNSFTQVHVDMFLPKAQIIAVIQEIQDEVAINSLHNPKGRGHAVA